MNAEADLARFVQRRRLDAYEQSMARLGYAYGVDIRRARFIVRSTFGNALVRAVDRAWPRVSAALLAEEGPIRRPGGEHAVPTDLLHELADIVTLLRAPTPAIRVLDPARDHTLAWPAATPLGSTHGDVNWAVLDVPALMDRESDARRFALAHVLAHLQCDHAVFTTAYLMAARDDGSLGVRFLRRVLGPWARVMVFSADRAAALAIGDVDRTLAALAFDEEDRAARPGRQFWPPIATRDAREEALRDFGRSVVFARTRALRSRDGHASVFGGAGRPGEPVEIPDDAWSLARCDRRLTERLGLF